MPRRTATSTIKDSVAEEQDSMKTELEDALSPKISVAHLWISCQKAYLWDMVARSITNSAPVWSNGRATSFPSSGLSVYTDVGN